MEKTTAMLLRGAQAMTGVTQLDLARITGISDSTLSAYFHGQRRVSRDILSRIILGIYAPVLAKAARAEADAAREREEMFALAGD